MGKHTSAGAALAQHGMSERASQSRQPSPPPPDRSRAPAKRGLDSTLDLLELPLPCLLSRQRGGMGGGARGPRGYPRSQRGPARVRAGGRGLRGAPNPRGLLQARGRGGPRRAPRAAERSWGGAGSGTVPGAAGARVPPAALPRAGWSGGREARGRHAFQLCRSRWIGQTFGGRTLPPSPVCRAQQLPRVPRVGTRLLV